GYQNANAELWLIALWPALALASAVPRRSIGRPLWMAVATLLAEVSLLSQSRGAILAMLACGAAFVLLSRPRGRALSGLATVAGACALAWGNLSAARAARSGGDLAGAFSGARLAIVLSCLGVAALVLAADALAPAAAGLLRRLRPRPAVAPGARRTRRRRALGLVWAALMVVVIAGHPVGWAQARWHDFKDSGYSRVDSGSTRLAGGLGSNRYDFYRVAIDEWLAHPVVGIGADNFRDPYLAARRSPEAPRYPHSLPLAVLSELGLVGAVLFAGFLGLTGRGLVGPVRRGPPVALGACLGFASWVVHASVDWLWEFPGLGVLAFVLLAIALGSHRRGGPPPVRAARPRPVVVAGAVLLGAAVVAAFAVQLLTQRAVAAGERAAAAHPVAAMADFERAASLDSAAADPLVSEAILASRLGRPAVALDALRRAIVRVPGDWFAHFELGVVDAGQADRSGALAELGRAHRLDPGQPTITATAALVAAGRQLSPGAIGRQLTAPINRRLSATGG
ncbi:MAG: hypothetical protein QOE27_2136, partial [Solirubrobacteraceae bacterium]|nr:hypothetical protein [Solirubrobacteraceae bacterium]